MALNEKNALQPPFEVLRPDKLTNPVLFNSPHSGRQYPNELRSSSLLSAKNLRRSEDYCVDKLFEDAPSRGSALLKAHFPRAYLDVNREPWELDPAMFDGPLPNYINSKSLRVANGLGTVARIVGDGMEIYRDKLNFDDIKTRIESLYFPYHQVLSDLITETHGQFGQTLLVDCHSMPSSAVSHLGTARGSCDIILGDRYGTSCSQLISDWLDSAFSKAGYNVLRNKPYAGGHITQHYGQPQAHIHAIQIEINRALYINETSLTALPHIGQLKNDLNDIFAQLTIQLDNLLPKYLTSAAE